MKTKFNTVLLALVLCMGAFLMPMEAHAQGVPDAEEALPASASTDPEAAREPVPFTPEGQASVVDHATDGDGKEFYTFSTPEGNVFYLVIDSQRESDNVYFLNAVTEADLMALAEGGSGEDSTGVSAIPEIKVCTCKEKCAEGWADVSCPVCREDLGECKGKAVQEDPLAEGEVKESGKGEDTGKNAGNGSTLIFILLAAAAAGGAGYYLKIYKPRHDLDDAEDLDELLGDLGGQEVNEDGEDPATDKTAWERDAQSGREMPGEAVGMTTGTAEATGRAWGMEGTGETEDEEGSGSGGDAALYDDYPEDDYPDSPDDMQEG